MSAGDAARDTCEDQAVGELMLDRQPAAAGRDCPSKKPAADGARGSRLEHALANLLEEARDPAHDRRLRGRDVLADLVEATRNPDRRAGGDGHENAVDA